MVHGHQTFSGHSTSITAIAPSPDGRTLLSGDMDGQIILWDAATAQEIRRGHGFTPVFTADGRTALSGQADGSLVLWDVNTGAEVRRFEGAQRSTVDLQISPDGQRVMACDASGVIRLWDFPSGQPIRTIVVPDGCHQGRFTPDGQYLLTNGIVLWDIASGEMIRQYPFGIDMVLSPDGRSFFASAGKFRSPEIFEYRIDSLDQLVGWTLNHRVVREPDCDERTMYQLEPGCDAVGAFPTRTPYPTSYPTATFTPVPASDLAVAATVTPSVTPRPTLIAHAGENRGEVPLGGDQVWQYTGQAGEILTIRANADLPVNGADQTALPAGMLDTLVIVTAPDGRDLNVYNSGGGTVYSPAQSDDIDASVNTDSLVDGLVLPVSGTYQIVVSGSGYRTGGLYTLTVASQMPEDMTPTPSDGQ